MIFFILVYILVTVPNFVFSLYAPPFGTLWLLLEPAALLLDHVFCSWQGMQAGAKGRKEGTSDRSRERWGSQAAGARTGVRDVRA